MKDFNFWISGELDSFYATIGDIFTIKYPNWSEENLYDFN